MSPSIPRRPKAGLGPRRLAELSTAHPWRVLAVWGVVALLALVTTMNLLASGMTSEGGVTASPESKQAAEVIDQRLPGRDEVDELIVVRSAGATTDDPEYRAYVRTLIGALDETGGVAEVQSFLDPGQRRLVSADRRAALLPVVLSEDKADSVERVIAAVARADGAAGFTADITGTHTVNRDFDEVAAHDLKKGELQFGLPAALLVLLLVFGTLVGAAIPLVMALLSIVVSFGVISVIGQAFELNLFIQNMVVAMGLALGIDYSLFIVSRLREERLAGAGRRAAILAVAGTATRAVVFSGTAFALALVGMLLVPDTVLRSLGLGAVVVGIVSVLVALTFHPALLMVLGDRIERLRLPVLGRRIAASSGSQGRFWGAAVRAVVRRPGRSLIAAVTVLALAATPVLGLDLGASGSASLPEHTVARQGLTALERDFPSGATNPVNVVIARDPAATPTRAAIDRLQTALARDRDFAASSMSVERGRDVAVLAVALQAHPSSERATAAIDRLRDRHVPAAFGDAASDVRVGGRPAESRDYFALVGRWLPIVMAFVLALTTVLLTVAFRSIVVPLTAVAVNLLSVGAAYGLLVLVFQQGVGAGLLGLAEVERIDAWVPVFLFSVLFGLSMDYQVFLLSRISERYAATRDIADSLTHAVGSTARLITGAALIIVVVFSGFATGELVAFQQMGFGVAAALLIDATIVRSVLMPAAMQLLGERNWYLPRWLEWLPRIQIESAPDARSVQRATEIDEGEASADAVVAVGRRERDPVGV